MKVAIRVKLKRCLPTTFRTSEIHTAAVYTVPNYFCWPRPNV